MKIAEATKRLKEAIETEESITTVELKEILMSMNFSFSKPKDDNDEVVFLKKTIRDLRTKNRKLKKTVEKYQERVLKK